MPDYLRRGHARARLIVAVVFVIAGVLHFVIAPFYLAMMPPWLPAHLLLVQVSGVAEILLGLGVLVDRTRVIAGWGLIALLIAVFPANVQMLLNAVASHAGALSLVLLTLRLPLQWVIGRWVYRVAVQVRAPTPATA
jgi:uncharacterized membrane protein